MCNAKPGLRCNTHAVQKVNAQQTKIADLMSAIKTANESERGQLVTRLQAAEERLRKDTLEYMLTPDGQQEIIDSIRRKQLRGEDKGISDLYQRLGRARELADHRQIASRRVEANLTPAEELVSNREHAEFVNALEESVENERGTWVRREKRRLLNISNNAREQYTSLLNSGTVLPDYEDTLVRKIKSAKYRMSKLDSYEADMVRAAVERAHTSGTTYASCRGC